MRINQPIGLLLLLWPTLWALWIANGSIPSFRTLIIFVLGVFFMRSAGCVINDYTDQKIDGYVKRTCIRPLPNRAISNKEAKSIFFILIGISFILVLMLNKLTIFMSVIALILTLIYPFTKRYIYFPQLILGITFSWSIPMAFTAVNNSLSLNCWILFLANTTWTIAYDTQYAMIDREDDLNIGIKSTAILFGRFDKLVIALLHFLTLILLIIVGYRARLNYIYYIFLASASALFIWQQKIILIQDKQALFRAFLNNNFVGMLIFIGIFTSYYYS